VSNKVEIKALANSVLPTPVGPRKMNEPTGREGSAIPALDHLRALSEDSPLAPGTRVAS